MKPFMNDTIENEFFLSKRRYESMIMSIRLSHTALTTIHTKKTILRKEM